ncbi:unnamed protein product [Symbiodinium sp. CCMP2592]|nr:unnamed protein product [Symbiodinium sp. CCMP2592]
MAGVVEVGFERERRGGDDENEVIVGGMWVRMFHVEQSAIGAILLKSVEKARGRRDWSDFDGAAAGVGEHSVEGEDGEALGFGVDAHDVSGDGFVVFGGLSVGVEGAEAVEDPEEVGLVDAVHGGAEALAVGEHGDFDAALAVLVGESVDEVDFCADGPAGSWCGVLDRVDYELGRSGEVGEIDDFFAALGVDEDLHGFNACFEVFVVLADLGAVFWCEEFWFSALCFLGVVDAGIARYVDPEGGGGVASEVLVWEEEDFDVFALLAWFGAAVHGPFEDLSGVGGGAAGAAVVSDECFDGGGGVDVGDGDDAAGPWLICIEVMQGFVDEFPRFDGLLVVGHVGHGASCGEVWEDDLDGVGCEDVCGFCHEVDAAENDVGDGGVCFGAVLDDGGGELRELEGVSHEVGVLDDGVHLVVVSEDEEGGPELFAAVLDARGEFRFRERVVGIGDGWLPEHGGL